MKALINTFIAIIFMSLTLTAEETGKHRIQVALLLDTSSSMDGLINQARSQLWKVINELSMAEKNGTTPKLEVSLFEYGKSSIPSGEGYMKMVTPFTRDLDRLSSDLFSLTTNGGDEYCGLVIDKAVKNLNWHRDDGNIKIIFIAGNEPFTQGQTNYREAISRAREKGIVVNTIFCGDHQTGVSTKWKDGADIGGGSYMNIDHNDAPQVINTPQDAEIYSLGVQLNSTYIPYGAAGEKRKMKQAKEDKNASGISESVAIERSISKASKHYVNSSWDLVDAYSKGKLKVESLDKKYLPAKMRKMNSKEKIQYIRSMQKKRQDIQAKIEKLNTKRREYISEKRKEMSSKKSLDSVMIESIKKEAVKKNFRFK